MGNQSAAKWQDDYEFVENIASSRIRARHKTHTDNFYEIATMAIADQQKSSVQSRIAQRQSDRNIYIQRIIRFSERPERTVCSNTQTYQLILRESTPTLADHCRYRRLKNRHFHTQQIFLVIRNVCLALSYLKSINQKHGQVDLTSIIVNREVYIKDPILVDRESGESLGYRKSVRGFPSPEKLREYYDCLINFDEYSSDLFSVGVVALQMAYLQRDLRQIYTIKNPQYDNNQINFKLLHELVHRVKDSQLKEWIRTLLHPEERYRKNIHQYFSGYKVNSSELRILKDNPLRVAPEEELIEPIQPYVETGHEIPANQSYNGFANINRSSSYILPVSHQGMSYPRPTLINQSFPVSVIRENRSIIEPNPSDMNIRSISFPKVTTSYHNQSFTETKPIQYNSPLNFSFPKPPQAISQSKYQPATLQDSKLDLSSLSQSFSKLSANLKSLIESQEKQLHNKYVPIDTTYKTSLPEVAPGKPLKKKQSKYTQFAVPIIPEVQEDHSNMTESQYVVEQYQIGTKYEGLKKNGRRNGTGKFYYSEGSYYDGEWKDNKMHGFGTLTYPNGTIAYRGQWKDDQFQGKGVLYNNDPTPIARMYDYTDMSQIDSVWIMYQGEMQRGKRHGFGKLMLMNGQYYEGHFVEDKVQGTGEFHTLSGGKISGVWKDFALQALRN